jgi:predicted metal-dependent HD superfamily phosphohydrolase
MTNITLKEAWNFALEQFPEIDIEIAHIVYDELVTVYTDPVREYHSSGHIENFINKLNELLRIYAFDEHDKVKAELIFAAFFHDYFHNAHRHTQEIPIDSLSDEEMSADFALNALKRMGVRPSKSVSRIYQLIKLTETHQLDNTSQCSIQMQKVFLDADMAILGDIDPKYEEYMVGVWKEYAHIPPETFMTGRINFLSQLLEKNAIFHTVYMNQLYRDQAFKNISYEIGILDKMNAEQLIKAIQG